MKPWFQPLGLWLAFVCVGVASVSAADPEWVGGTSDISAPANWTTPPEFGTTEDVTFGAIPSTPQSVQFNQTITLHNLTFSGSTRPAYTFTGAPGTLILTGNIIATESLGSVGVTFASSLGLTLASGAHTIQLGAVDTLTIGSVIAETAGTASIQKTGSGTLTLTGANTFTGGVAINGGVLEINGDTALGDTSGGLAFADGSLRFTNSVTSARNITLNNGGGTIDSNSFQGTFSGTITGSGGLTKSGLGVLSLSGTNDYTGGTTVTGAGVLDFTAEANLGATSSSVTLDGGYLRTRAAVADFTHALVLGAGGGNLNSENFDSTLSGLISGEGRLSIRAGTNGNGSITLSNTGNTYSGGTYIGSDGENEPGALRISDDRNLGAVPGSFDPDHLILDKGTLNTTATFPLHKDRGITLDAGGGTIETNSGTTLTYEGVIVGAAPLTKTGGGTLQLTGSSPSGPNKIFVNSGTLELAGTGTLNSGTDIKAGPSESDTQAKLLVSENQTIRGLAGYGLVEIAHGRIFTANLPTEHTEFNEFYGRIIGDGAFVKDGPGILCLRGANAYLGGTTIAAGTLQLGDTTIAHADADFTVNNGWADAFSGTSITNKHSWIRGSSGETGMATLDGQGTTWTTISNLHVGDAGTGILTVLNHAAVSAAATVLGYSALSEGIMSVGSHSSLSTNLLTIGAAGSGILSVWDGGTVAVNNGAGTITLAGATDATGVLNIGADSQSDALAGGIINAASIYTAQNTGTGTVLIHTTATEASPYYLTNDGAWNGTPVTLTGATRLVNQSGHTAITGTNTYTGDTHIYGGVLTGSANNAFGSSSGTITVYSGGVLALKNGVRVSNPITLNSGSTIAGSGKFADNTIVIGNGVTLRPEAAEQHTIGELTFDDLTLQGGGTYQWNLLLPTEHDQVYVENPATLTIAATTSNRFNLKLISLSAPGTPGVASGFESNGSYTFTIFNTLGIDGFAADKFSIDGTEFLTDAGSGVFSLVQNGNLLQLGFTPIPEPSTWALLIAGLTVISADVLRRRRRR